VTAGHAAGKEKKGLAELRGKLKMSRSESRNFIFRCPSARACWVVKRISAPGSSVLITDKLFCPASGLLFADPLPGDQVPSTRKHVPTVAEQVVGQRFDGFADF
jgi:hypothetical protein